MAEYLDYPFHVDRRGRSASTSLDAHIRDLIYQVLFTAPGERVNRPDFGSGIRRLVFMGNSDPLATATQFLVQGSLQRWLGDLIALERVTVLNQDERLVVEVVYSRRDNNEREQIQFFAPPTASAGV
jgi:phage baseplate assembly protein W